MAFTRFRITFASAKWRKTFVQIVQMLRYRWSMESNDLDRTTLLRNIRDVSEFKVQRWIVGGTGGQVTVAGFVETKFLFILRRDDKYNVFAVESFSNCLFDAFATVEIEVVRCCCLRLAFKFLIKRCLCVAFSRDDTKRYEEIAINLTG